MTGEPARRRRSIRAEFWDYDDPGAYFVTVCAHHRACLFGLVRDGSVALNRLGVIVEECWMAIPVHVPDVELDAFIVMPNHMHGIIVIQQPSDVGAQHAAPLPQEDDNSPRVVRPRSLSAIVRSFKSAASREINALRGTPAAPVWQRNYYERIIRNEREMHAIRGYIMNNPYRWSDDPENLGNWSG